MTELT